MWIRATKTGVKVLVVILVIYSLSHLIMTGSPFPISMIEHLNQPTHVNDWSDLGLILEDGKTLQLPGYTKLPNQSAALSQAISRGVEVTPNGRVIGLVRIHHWCGNDPVRYHIVKVDLSRMLMFLNEGEYETPETSLDPELFEIYRPESSHFSDAGWNQSQYYRFQNWSSILNNTSEPSKVSSQ